MENLSKIAIEFIPGSSNKSDLVRICGFTDSGDHDCSIVDILEFRTHRHFEAHLIEILNMNVAPIGHLGEIVVTSEEGHTLTINPKCISKAGVIKMVRVIAHTWSLKSKLPWEVEELELAE